MTTFKTLTTIARFTILTTILPSTASAQIIRVPTDQPTIQAGINHSENGDTVLVMPGTYYENINLKGKKILLGSLFVTTGDLSWVGKTVIDGSKPVHPDTTSCILIISREDTTTVIAGFTITGGKGTRWEDEHGPNNYYTEGGGILIQYSSPVIRNNIIINNEATKKGSRLVSAGGGGIRCGDGNPRILNNLIMNNKGLYGGGIVLNYSGAVIRNNIIAKNSGGQDFGGGGIWMYGNGANPKSIENNTITLNSSTTTGGGVENTGTASLTNNIIYGNTAPNTTKPDVHGSPKVTYCNVKGGFTGTGNINSDPGFFDAFFSLPDDSPCIDAGNPDSTFYDPEDPLHGGFALHPARGTIRNDMGAYGGRGSQAFPVPSTSAVHSIPIAAAEFVVYPNPVMDEFTIRLGDDGISPTHINLLDQSGHIVFTKTLDEDSRVATIKLDGQRPAPGIYIIQLLDSRGTVLNKLINIQ
jgi:hypothetical protein